MGPKKKLSKAEKKRMEMERLEKARIQAELEAQRALEEERRRLEMERKLADEKEKRETAEQALRVEQLTNSNNLIKSILDHSFSINSKEKEDFEWEQYLKCDGLPDPTKPPLMSTYLHLWEKVNTDVTVEECKNRTSEIIGLLNILDDFIDDPFDASESLIANWKWIRTLCRERQQENLDMATYNLLRRIDNNLNRIDIPTADFTIIDEHFVICLWLFIELATPMHNPRAPPKKRLEINFPETRLSVLFPTILDSKRITIRAVYVKYDHFSDTCATYDPSTIPPELDRDLFEVTSREWYIKMKYKWDNRQSLRKKSEGDKRDENEAVAPAETLLREGEIPPPVPYQRLDPTASQYAMNLEGKKSKKGTASDDSLQKSDDQTSPKKGKKAKKKRSDTSISTGDDKKSKKKGKKEKKGDEALGEGKSDADFAETNEAVTGAKLKRKKKERPAINVSWVDPKKKRAGSSSMIFRDRSSLLKVRSHSGSILKNYSDIKGSMISMTSNRSYMESKSALSWAGPKKPKKKRSKKSSKSWLFLDDEESYEDEVSQPKDKKDKKSKKGKKGKKESKEKDGSAAVRSPKEIKDKKKGKKDEEEGKKEEKEKKKEKKKVEKEKKEGKKPLEAKDEAEKPDRKPGKKGKKKKGTAATEPQPEPEPDDVMAQIMKMKAQAAAQAAGVATVEQEAPKEEKPKAKKKEKDKKKKKKAEEAEFLLPRKVSERERIRMELEKQEQERIQAELEVQRQEEEERRRHQEEMRLGREKDKREMNEQQLRIEQLAVSNALIKNMLDYNCAVDNKKKVNDEWQQYLKCDGLPDPSSPASMNTYLHLWDQVINDVNVEDVKHRTNEIIGLLEELQDIIDDPLDASESLIADWKWVKTLCRKHQQENLDMATYRLLRDIDSRLNRIDIPTADFNIIDDNFKLCLWLYVQLATPMYNPRAQVKKPLEMLFPDMGLTCVFPVSLDTKFMAIRAVYVHYDHLSDTCALYDDPPIPEQLNKDLYEMVGEEWYRKMKYKWERRKLPPRKTIEDADGNVIDISDPEQVIPEGELPPLVPFQKLDPTASRCQLDVEEEMYHTCKDNLYVDVDQNIVHLRKFLIIGGVYYLDLFYQPPQPHDQVAFDIRITALQIPKKLCEVPIYVPYKQRAVSTSEVKKPPEVLEEELKQQEAELDKLIMITLTLPDHVMFLDLPIVCQWNKNKKVWTTEDVHDVKHIEEKNYITFRTGRFGPFALAVNRFINLPFQAWELKPEADGTVTFQITCAILMVEFNVKNNRICLTQLQNSPNNALQDIIGVYYKLPKLMRILRNGGIDLFPACDAFCYISDSHEKHWSTEKHLYYNMAQLSPCYNFAWSRWNGQLGRRCIALQMREYRLDKQKQKNHSMLLVSPMRATLIETTEVSPVFNDTPVEGTKFYSDLYHLMKSTSSMWTRNAIQNGPQDVAKALSDLLIMTRVISFS